MSAPQSVCVLGCLLYLKLAVFVCFCTLRTMTSKASELWIKPVVHCVDTCSRFLKRVAYQLRNYMCTATAIEFIVGIWNWKCLRLEEMSGFKSGILKLYTVYSDSKALLIKHGDWMSLACNWCAEGCVVSAGVMPSKRRTSVGSESVWWFRVIVWQLMEREWKTAWQNFTTLWSDGWS